MMRSRICLIVDLRLTIDGERRHRMNCFECAKVNDEVAAVGVCQQCGVGLCLDHLVEARAYRVGGTVYGCGHELPTPKQLRQVPAGIAHGPRHVSAGVK
jgi:hypothetical protein